MMLNGKHKVAAFLLNLSKEEAAEVLKFFTEDQILGIAETMKEISGKDISHDEISTVFSDFDKRLKKRSKVFRARSDEVDELFSSSLGPNLGGTLLNELDNRVVPESPFRKFTKYPKDVLVKILNMEHPQTIALVLSQIDSNKAAQVLIDLEEDIRLDIVTRIANLKAPSKEILRNVAAMLSTRVRQIMVEENPDDIKERLQTVADVLNRVDKDTEKSVLGKISETDAEMAEEIKDLMFSFDDLVLVDKRAMQKILSGINVQVLALALKGANKAVEGYIMDNVSKRVKKLIFDEKELLGPKPIEEVIQAQKEVVATVRVLIESGEISINRSSEEELLA